MEMAMENGNVCVELEAQDGIRKTVEFQKKGLAHHFKPKLVCKGCTQCIIYFISIHECEFKLNRPFKENQPTQEEFQ